MRETALVAAVLLVVPVATGCRAHSDAREARRVFADASAPGTGTCWPGSAQRKQEGFETSCELALATDWNDYKRWLRSRLEPQYQTRTETRDLIAFSRALDGDLYTVTATLMKDGTAQSVKVTFRSAPW